MDMNMIHSLIGKVFKGFVAGGVGAVGERLATHGFTVSSIADLHVLAHAIVIAFISGGMLAVMKWWTWRSAP